MVPACWPAPANVRAYTTTRVGGCSSGLYSTFNLADHVGDAPGSVASNRELLHAQLGSDVAVQWLQQVHGDAVVKAGSVAIPEADGVFSTERKQACAILTADCLPILLCDDRGRGVAALHAGWRGVLGGIIEVGVKALSHAVGTEPEHLLAWFGPAIGPAAFEVGPEVRDAFLEAVGPARNDIVVGAFAPSRGRSGHYLADLNALASDRLQGAGVSRIFGGSRCTFSEASQYFSYRRDGRTGRMASLIYLI